MSDWHHYPLLWSRKSLRFLLERNEENLSASAKEAGCSLSQLKMAMAKHVVLTEKEREMMNAEESELFSLLRES